MKFLRRLSIKRYYKYKDEVVKRNDIASQTFLMVGTIVAIVNLLSNVFIKKTNGYFQSIILVAYFLVAFVIRCKLQDKNVQKVENKNVQVS